MMNVVEKFTVSEPQWILDRKDSIGLYWRRKSCENTSRVKFRHDVEIKEFIRSDYEMEDTYLSNDNQETNVLTMGMTCLICVTFTVLLPWYILIGTN